MTTLMFAVVLHASIVAAGPETYADAHRETNETGKPLVVMVSTDWCVPCQQMKKNVIPQVRQRGLLRKVAFAFVNPDRDGELARKLTGGGPVPQLVMFRKTKEGWMRRKLVGGQSVDSVEKFIHEGVASDEATKNSEAEAEPESSTRGDRAETSKSDHSAQQAEAQG